MIKGLIELSSRGRRRVLGLNERERVETLAGLNYGFYAQNSQAQMEFLISKGLEPQHTLLDVGCGPLSGGLAFIEYLQEGNYAGIDVQPESIAEGKTQIEKANLSRKAPLVAVSESFGREELGDRGFDFMWAYRFLQQLEEQQMQAFLQQVASRMKPDSKLFANAPLGEDMRAKWKAFPYIVRPLKSYREMAALYGLNVEDLGLLQDLGFPVQRQNREAEHDNHMLSFTILG